MSVPTRTSWTAGERPGIEIDILDVSRICYIVVSGTDGVIYLPRNPRPNVQSRVTPFCDRSHHLVAISLDVVREIIQRCPGQ